MPNNLARALNSAWTIIKYAAGLALVGLIILLVLLGSAYGDLATAGRAGLNGKGHLEAAAQSAAQQDWTAALASAAAASHEFSAAQEALARSRQNLVVKNLLPIRRQIDDLDYLVQTAQILSRSLEHILPVAQQLSLIQSNASSRSFGELPEADKRLFLQTIYEAEPELAGLEANIKLARLNLQKIHRVGILYPVYGQISDIGRELDQAAALLADASPLVKLLPVLAGYPTTSRFLLILQNNDELRPSGGFIGTYGLLSIRNGQIISLNTDDSYHLDMPASLNAGWQTEPPAPLKKYLAVEKWYLRDANWSPDWPTSARKIIELYNGESRAIGQPATDFTGVVAINPDLVADLIRLVGPITVKGTTYDADNFQPLLQYNVEVAYKDQAISAWDRKDIIDELMAELRQRLFNLSSDRWTSLLRVLTVRLSTRDIQLYFPDSGWESLARALGGGGEVKNFLGDYFLVVDANFGAFKSDAVVKKNIDYSIGSENGSLDAALKLTYQHEGGFDWRTTRYRSYTRVFLPLGSQLRSIDGLVPDTADISRLDDPALDKTVFGFFLTVEPGNSREVTINYTLPDRIYQQFRSGDYQLLAQKQSGQRVESLNIKFTGNDGKLQEIRGDFTVDKLFYPSIFNQ